MAYIHVPTGRYPLSAKHIRAENPDVSFPEIFAPTPDYVSVASSDQPAHNPATHKLNELQPVQIEGVWTQQWEVVELSEEEAAARATEKASKVRADRNSRLAASDFTQLSDAPVDQAAWAAYRQALRDISSQPGFPWAVEWPTIPA